MEELNEMEVAVQLANGEFIKGFITGQLILCILIFFLLKVFLFKSSSSFTENQTILITGQDFEDSNLGSLKPGEERLGQSTLRNRFKKDSTKANEIGEINGILHVFLQKFKSEANLMLIVKLLQEGINSKKPGLVEFITVKEFQLFNLEFISVNSDPALRSHKVEFELKDLIIVIDTKISIKGLILPILIRIHMLKFTAALNITQSLSNNYIDDFEVEFKINSLLGSRTKVKDLPKLTDLITRILKDLMKQYLINYKFDIPIPDLARS
jgi:maintenance of morphology protein 1